MNTTASQAWYTRGNDGPMPDLFWDGWCARSERVGDPAPVWQPIESAPRGPVDGDILVWDGQETNIACWGQISGDLYCWTVRHSGDQGDVLCVDATHWMPLPKPPTP
jgi:uncharacterized protein DUF551